MYRRVLLSVVLVAGLFAPFKVWGSENNKLRLMQDFEMLPNIFAVDFRVPKSKTPVEDIRSALAINLSLSLPQYFTNKLYSDTLSYVPVGVNPKTNDAYDATSIKVLMWEPTVLRKVKFRHNEKEYTTKNVSEYLNHLNALYWNKYHPGEEQPKCSEYSNSLPPYNSQKRVPVEKEISNPSFDQVISAYWDVEIASDKLEKRIKYYELLLKILLLPKNAYQTYKKITGGKHTGYFSYPWYRYTEANFPYEKFLETAGEEFKPLPSPTIFNKQPVDLKPAAQALWLMAQRAEHVDDKIKGWLRKDFKPKPIQQVTSTLTTVHPEDTEPQESATISQETVQPIDTESQDHVSKSEEEVQTTDTVSTVQVTTPQDEAPLVETQSQEKDIQTPETKLASSAVMSEKENEENSSKECVQTCLIEKNESIEEKALHFMERWVKYFFREKAEQKIISTPKNHEQCCHAAEKYMSLIDHYKVTRIDEVDVIDFNLEDLKFLEKLNRNRIHHEVKTTQNMRTYKGLIIQATLPLLVKHFVHPYFKQKHVDRWMAKYDNVLKELLETRFKQGVYHLPCVLSADAITEEEHEKNGQLAKQTIKKVLKSSWGDSSYLWDVVTINDQKQSWHDSMYLKTLGLNLEEEKSVLDVPFIVRKLHRDEDPQALTQRDLLELYNKRFSEYEKKHESYRLLQQDLTDIILFWHHEGQLDTIFYPDAQQKPNPEPITSCVLTSCKLKDEWLTRKLRSTWNYDKTKKEWKRELFQKFEQEDVTKDVTEAGLSDNLLTGKFGSDEPKSLSLPFDFGKLTKLTLDKNPISSCEFLLGLTNLRVVSLKRSGIVHMFQINPSVALKWQELYLDDNEIANTEFLKVLPDLEIVSLKNNGIQKMFTENRTEDFKPIGFSFVCKWRALYLDNNEIKDIDFLKILPDLEILSLQNNRIKGLTIPHELKHLQKLDLSKNKLTWLQFEDLPKVPQSSTGSSWFSRSSQEIEPEPKYLLQELDLRNNPFKGNMFTTPNGKFNLLNPKATVLITDDIKGEWETLYETVRTKGNFDVPNISILEKDTLDEEDDSTHYVSSRSSSRSSSEDERSDDSH